jgi:UDP:flavonoid glycosyltransferase YjiC (YdhE family)
MNGPLQIIIAVLGSGGDVYPLIAIGSALAARGHHVHFMSSPHFAAPARAAGLVFHRCVSEENERRALEDPDLWKPGKGFRVLIQGLLDNIPETYRLICELFVPGRTVVIANASVLSARVARETLGVPLVTVHLQPLLLRSRFVQPGIVVSGRWTFLVRAFRAFFVPAVDRWFFDPAVAPTLNRFRGQFGLPPVRRVYDKWIHSPDLVLGLFPEWYAEPQPDWPANTHLIGFPAGETVAGGAIDDTLETFLQNGPPPIVFTAGTSMAFGRTFFERSVEACRKSGRRALMLTQYPEQLPPLPDHVRHVAFAPFNRLLPRAAALVHHGGIGTMAAAFTAGIPQIVVPFNFDQPDNGARLQSLGAGRLIRPASYTSDVVSRVIDELLSSPAVQRTCATLAQHMKTARAASEACDRIEALAGASLVDAAKAQAS